jgi:ubiquinol-cytochrome c reductase iron-sulfur subunit
VRLLGRLLAAIAVWLAGRRALRGEPVPPRHEPPPEPDPRDRRVGSRPGAEGLVAALLACTGACGAAFALVAVLGADPQLLGLVAGLGLAALAVALALASFRVVPQVTEVEDRGALADAAAQADVADELRAGGQGVSRRRLLAAAAGAAGAGLGAAAVVPAASLGPRLHGRLIPSPWRAGRRLVDEDGRPVAAGVLDVGAFLTAFPEGADRREPGSAVVVVRVDPRELRMAPERRGWAPGGHAAFSKVCTHAGCAVSLYRSPTYEPTSSPPALVCPCHYSTFDVRRSARVVFGPAGRPLPQLPLAVGADGILRAAGPLSGPVGPAWWGVG